MGKGRPPKPKVLHDLAGNPGKRRYKETDAPSGFPPMPESIKDDPIASAEWKYTCKSLDDMRLLARTDKSILELYCATYSQWRAAQKIVKEQGDVMVRADGHAVLSANYRTMITYSDSLRRLLIELGLTPAARARMRTEIKSKKPQSKWDGILKVAN